MLFAALACLATAPGARAEDLPLVPANGPEAKAEAAAVTTPPAEKVDRVALCKLAVQTESDREMLKYEAAEMSGKLSHDEADEIRSVQFHKVSKAYFACDKIEAK